ncbi:MAG: hypothetical protein O2955_20000, partial [Planctomycetota bacterium]|nr:hypothetical protein [Planctomycetota bacterium]
LTMNFLDPGGVAAESPILCDPSGVGKSFDSDPGVSLTLNPRLMAVIPSGSKANRLRLQMSPSEYRQRPSLCRQTHFMRYSVVLLTECSICGVRLRVEGE